MTSHHAIKIIVKRFVLYVFRPSSPNHTESKDGEGEGENESDPRKFDSTGMFHWCPEQPLSSCLVVSILS